MIQETTKSGKTKSIARDWWQRCPFQGEINKHLFRNYLIVKFIQDESLRSKFGAFFHGSKFKFYWNYHFERHVKRLSKATGVDIRDLKTYLLFEARGLYIDAGNYSDFMYDPKDDFRRNNVQDLQVFENFTNLELLSLTDCYFQDFLPLQKLKSLKLIEIQYAARNSDQFTNISVLNSLPILEYLCLQGLESINMRELGNKSIKYLDVTGSNLNELGQLEGFENLVLLNVSHCKLTSLEGIERFKQLRVLIVKETTLQSLEAIRDNTSLTHLAFNNKIGSIPQSELLRLQTRVPGLKLIDMASYHSPDVFLYRGGSGTFVHGRRRIPTSIENGIEIWLKFEEQHYLWPRK